jgi:hypothetical protein
MKEKHNKYAAAWCGKGEMPSVCKEQNQEVLISFFFFYRTVVLNQNSEHTRLPTEISPIYKF